MIERKDFDFELVNPETVNESIEPKNMPESHHSEWRKRYWLYALKLEHSKYYVGYTGKRNPYDRIMDHVNNEGDGAKWTEKYPPTEVLEIRRLDNVTKTEAKAYEQNLAWVYILKHKIKNVRGGIINYPGRMLRIGERVFFGYEFSTYILAFAFITQSIYLLWLFLKGQVQ